MVFWRQNLLYNLAPLAPEEQLQPDCHDRPSVPGTVSQETYPDSVKLTFSPGAGLPDYVPLAGQALYAQ